MHTQGIWTVKKAIFCTVIEAQKDEYYVCSMIEDNKSWKANAKLIAAAPDLLEALKEAYGYILNHDPSLYPVVPTIDIIEEAIAKVEGE